MELSIRPFHELNMKKEEEFMKPYMSEKQVRDADDVC
jgi:hypothetical protein